MFHSVSKRLFLIVIACIVNINSHAQLLNNLNPFKKSNKQEKEDNPNPIILNQLRTDVVALCSDKMEGRKMGSRGALEVVNYIEKRFQQIGLRYYNNKYRRAFKFIAGRQASPQTKLFINNKPILIPYEAFPFAFSATSSEERYILPDSKEPNNFWVIPLYENQTEANNSHQDWEKLAYNKAIDAQAHGADGVIFYDNFGAANPPQYTSLSSFTSMSIPVWMITKKGYDDYIKNMKAIRPINVTTDFKYDYNEGYNVFGYIDNGAAKTVIIAANFDGKGKDHSGRIYPSANNNASGIAVMLSVAQELNKSGLKKYNYLFTAFSGGEDSALGAQQFVNSKGFDASKIAYVIDISRVGRMSYYTRTLTIGGVGYAAWKNILEKPNTKLKLDLQYSAPLFNDYIPFFKNKLPYLFFFGGFSDDDNTVNDMPIKLNYNGMYYTTTYVIDLIKQIEQEPLPIYQIQSKSMPVSSPANTNNTSNTINPSNTTQVSLGITPDLNSNNGLLVNDVAKGKVANIAGISKGDIIFQIGIYVIKSYSDYTNAIAKFTKGKQAVVKVKRDNTIRNFIVKF